jgi:hypothetical protein
MCVCVHIAPKVPKKKNKKLDSSNQLVCVKVI